MIIISTLAMWNVYVASHHLLANAQKRVFLAESVGWVSKKVFKSSCFHKRTGQRIKPSPPFKDLHGVASRHEGMNSLHKRKRHESIK
jgi:hypothetical protein